LAASVGKWLGLKFRLDTGLSLKWAQQVLDNTTRGGLLIDAGALAAFPIGKWRVSLGLAYRNGGPISRDELAPDSTLHVGGVFGGSPVSFLTFKLLADLALGLDSPSTQGQFGLDWELIKGISLRAGYLLGEKTMGTRGLTFGAGFRLPIGNVALELDYAAIPLGDLGTAAHQIQLGAQWPLPGQRGDGK
jgi:hypothetical protein